MLTIIDPSAQSDLNRQIARASFTLCDGKAHFNVCRFRDAARLMGRAFNPETNARLTALHCVDFAHIPEPVIMFLDELRAAILN